MDEREIIEVIRNTYLSHHKENTLKHVEEVAETAVRLAEIYDLDIPKVRLAALLHDISAIMSPQDVIRSYSLRTKYRGINRICRRITIYSKAKLPSRWM